MQKGLNFEEYIEVCEYGKAIGFRLDGDSFLYRYDKHGGWYDAEGNYYNSDAEKCNPPVDSSEDSDMEEKQKDVAEVSEEKILNVKLQKNTQRQETVRTLIELIDGYPEDKNVKFTIEGDNGEIPDEQLNKFLEVKGIKEKVVDGILMVDGQSAVAVAELQGSKVNNETLYLFVELYDSDMVKVLTTQYKSEIELINYLENLQFQYCKDFANVQYENDFFTMDVSRQMRKAIQQALPQAKLTPL